MSELGKLFIGLGLLFILFGFFISIAGRLPGDIYIKKDNFTFFFPVTSSILFSIVISLLLYLYTRFFR